MREYAWHSVFLSMPTWQIALGALGAGAGIAAWGAFHPASQLFGPTIRSTGRPGAMALTFDDGPNPAATPQVLDLLGKYNARATFFFIGRHVRQCPELAAEVAARGHAIGNHTETHPSLAWLSSRRIGDELASCQEAIHQATGHRPRWMRPPYGYRSPYLDAAARRAGLHGVVMWSRRLLYDWEPQPAENVIRRLRPFRGGDIVVLHDGWHVALNADRRHVVAALEYWLPRWRDAGLEWVTIDDFAAEES